MIERENGEVAVPRCSIVALLAVERWRRIGDRWGVSAA